MNRNKQNEQRNIMVNNKITIILDLDFTLITNKGGVETVEIMGGMGLFLKFLFDNFSRICIFTAAEEWWLQEMLNIFIYPTMLKYGVNRRFTKLLFKTNLNHIGLKDSDLVYGTHKLIIDDSIEAWHEKDKDNIIHLEASYDKGHHKLEYGRIVNILKFFIAVEKIDVPRQLKIINQNPSVHYLKSLQKIECS